MVDGSRTDPPVLVACELTRVLEGSRVRYPGQEHLRPMIVHDARCLCPVSRVQLGEVLPNRDELHPVTCGRGREHVELSEWRDVRGLVEHHEQRRVEALSYGHGPSVCLGDHLCDEGREERAQTALVVSGCAQVEGVVAVE
jgi:hypothetical protein